MRFMSTDELAVWNELLDSINKRPDLSTGERGSALIDALAEHEQAHDQWAAMAMDKLACDGAQRALTARSKYNSRATVAFTTADAIRSTRIGVKKPDGTYQQKLFVDVSWDELAQHIELLSGQLKSLGMSIALDRKVMKLKDQFPDSAGPADACKRLGVTVEQFIGAAA